MKILVCDGLHESGMALLKSASGIQVDAPGQWDAEQIAENIGSYDALVVRSRTRVTRDLLDRAERLKVIGRAGTGVDNIDIGAASARGILVMNTPGANAMAAAEHTLALMLALARHVPQAVRSVQEGRWEKKRFMGTELYEQTLGVIGLGRIGTIVADRALAMGMEVLGHDPYITPEAAAIRGVRWADLDTLLAQSDFITLHTPKTDETTHMINRATIAKMRSGTRIVNCARGGLIDEDALYEALKNGRLAGAALDVFDKEPPSDSPLLSLQNVIATPHLGASSIQAQANVAKTIASQLLSFLQQGLIRNAVNFPSMSTKVYKQLRPYLALAEKLGALQGQVSKRVERLEVEYGGPELEGVPLEPLTQTAVKGFLEPVLAEKVNLVNAPILLRERHVELVASTTSEPRGYAGLITIRAHAGNCVSSAAGTVFPGEGPRLIRLNTYRLEAELEGTNLIVQNFDRPGVIGVLGTTLGRYGVNIANMHLSRTPARDKAMAIIRVDNEVAAEAMATLEDHPDIVSVQLVTL